jgi:hypothetical protein
VVVVNQVDEELAAAGVRPCVGHAYGAAIVPVLAGELVLDGIAGPAPACACWVSPLNHEAVYDPMKDHAIVESILDELLEVAGGYWHVIVKLQCDVSHAGLEQHQDFVANRAFCHFHQSFYPKSAAFAIIVTENQMKIKI